MKKYLSVTGLIFFLLCVVYIFILPLVLRPSLERNWTPDQKVLAGVTFKEDSTISIENVRDIDYQSTSTYTLDYYDQTYNPDEIVRAWFIVEPFGAIGAAHTFVSFEFKDGKFLSISSEIRKEVGESFSPLLGLLRQYEMVYVVADERDVLRLRTNYRKDDVRLYPIQGNKEQVKQVFMDMIMRADSLSKNPEMYNTLTNNCTTNIIKHLRKVSTKDVPWWNLYYLFPANIDTLAYDLDFIDTTLSLEEARNYYFITDKAQKYDKEGNFSQLIRQFDEE